MAIKQTKDVAAIPSAELDDWGPVELPVSEQVMDAEISSFVAGHALFHPEEGDTIDIKAGDTVYFDNNSRGTWEVLETVRKACLNYKRD